MRLIELISVFIALVAVAGVTSWGQQAASSPQEDLARLRRLAPNPAFTQWLARTGELPPDFGRLPTQPYPPDPLLIERDGQVRAVTAGEWPVRREELRRLLEQWLLGHAPPPPGNVRGTIESKSKDDQGREVWQVMLEFGPDHAAKLRCWYYPPRSPGRHPVYMSDNRGYAMWGRLPADEVDFGICIYNATDPVYVPERKDQSEDYDRLFGNYDWSAFRRRGWSASRALDWLITLDSVDPNRVYIGGNSRSAKQAMVAAAFDDRFAGVVASSPGSGGSLFYRYCDGYYYGESVELLTGQFPDWVSPKVRFFAGRENKLPVDSPALYYLIAPRPLLMRTAWHDWVENTWAVERTYESALSVYRMLGAPGNLALRYGPGQHSPDQQTIRDFGEFLMLISGRKHRGLTPADLFPYRPFHVWDYETWARANAHKFNVASMPDRRNAPLLPRDEARKQLAWLLGDGPAYEPMPADFTRGESDEESTLLNRGSPAAPLRIKLTFGQNINASIYYPPGQPAGAGGNNRLPAVIFLAPLATSSGYVGSYRSGALPFIEFSRAGYATFCFDPIATADRQEERRGFYYRYPDWSLMGKMVLDARHAIDAAARAPDIDPQRIYLFGYGMGGMVATMTAAVDDRIAGAISVAGFTPMRTDTDSAGTGGIRRYSHLYGWMPRVGLFIGNESRLPVDFDDLLAATAPRPMLIVAPTGDWRATHGDIVTAVNRAAIAYQAAGAPGRLTLHSPDDWNRLTDGMLATVIQWLNQQSGATP
jgi:dienelactone hydrolase